MKTAVAAIVLAVIACVQGTQVSQCTGGKVEDISSKVSIESCTKGPCRLRKGHTVAIEFKFVPEKDIEKVSNNVFANIVGVPFPFIGVDGTDACSNIYDVDGTTKVGCPLKAGKEYHYKNNIDVLEIYPRLKLIVHWALKTNNGEDVLCFEVPARITN